MLKKSLICITAILAALQMLTLSVYADSRPVEEEPMYESFTYALIEGKVQTLKSPAPYRVEAQVDTDSLGVELLTPSDVCVYEEDVYIVDSSNNYIIHTDKNFRLLETIKGFSYEGKMQTFAAPEGISVTKDAVYIADTGNKRIVVLNKDGSCRSLILAPQDDTLAEDLVFSPRKIAADGKGRVYTVVKGAYEGIMELYEDGTFGGYVGSIPVQTDPWTLIWKQFMTKEQREKMQKFIPVEYTNLAADKDGFLYTVSVAADKQDSIRRLNAAGKDILNRNSLGMIPVTGVVEKADSFPADGELSAFVDIAVDYEGVCYALDSEYGRIYAYDEFGNLLYVFGGRSTGQTGTFPRASAIALLDSKVVVADSVTGKILLFSRTVYGEQIALGIQQYNDDHYLESIETWNTVLKYNRHFVLAYSKIGQALYQLEDYDTASSYFVKAGDQTNYSKSFSRQRDAWITDHFTWILLGTALVIIVIVLIWSGARCVLKKHPIKAGGVLDCLHYPMYVIIHPFDGFWDLKYEKRGRKWVATLLIILTIVAFAMERSLSGFAVSAVPDRKLDILYELQFVLVPLILFLTGNMAITTLMEGKGTFGQLYTAVGYALTPLVLIKIPMTLISNVLTQDEAMYITLLNAIAIIWVAMLLFAGLLSTHEYTAAKTVGTVVLTAASMAIICFICVLFFSLFSELVGFVYTLVQEMQYR